MRVESALIAAASVLVCPPASAADYRLPFTAGVSIPLSQDCDDSCCNDHVGIQKFAYDFSNGKNFAVRATRDGTVVHIKQSSGTGGVGSSFAKYANYVILDHGDGHLSFYWHLLQDSIDPAVRCNAFVRRGQLLAKAGTTGYSTGNHLHFQVGTLRSDMSGICECGADGRSCAPDEMHWNDFIPNAAHPTVPITMDDWPDSDQCADRRYKVKLVSQNEDAMEPIVTVDDADPEFSLDVGTGTARKGGAYGGDFKSAPTAPTGSPTAVGHYALGGKIVEPGVYELLGFVPFNKYASSAKLPHDVVARGARLTGLANQGVLGGGFHRIDGLGRVKLVGGPAESVTVRNDSGEADKSAGFDAIVAHWVADAGPGLAGDPCADAGDCVAELVCVKGACAVGCELIACGCGETCDVTGLCVPGGEPCEPDAGGGGGEASQASVATGAGGAGASAIGNDGDQGAGCACGVRRNEAFGRAAMLVFLVGVVATRRRRERAKRSSAPPTRSA